MLTHAQATQVKIAFAAHARPEQIAAELGVPLADVQAVLQRRRSRYASIVPRRVDLELEIYREDKRKYRLAQQAITGEPS